MRSSRFRMPALFSASLAVMIPWPLLGVLLLHAQLEQASEAFVLLGGITMFPLLILALFGVGSEDALIVIVALVWLGAAIAPWLLLRRRPVPWPMTVAFLVAQSIFALGQAAIGALLVAGKSV